ncbi:fatty acid desaturase family protein [Streptomyces apricus]|uniref:Fatty acid desaturase n=1 Tax=Streptomyces apricus TaxID=1828112 RepID=A0A5A9ZVR1_9ACTN|nr:fatty acid desaturase [Streptomyces apricus]KAA0921367.1 fatty acid desaturase [Streptomyces apricus]
MSATPATSSTSATSSMSAASLSSSSLPRDLKKFTARDAHVFAGKLVLCAAVSVGSAVWILTHDVWTALAGQFVLGVMFAHAVELQHQMLHGTGIRAPRWARCVGTALGAPMLVSYTRYRVLHLRHHRFLGTDQDTEFFRYSAGDALTLTAMGASAFDVRRWAAALRDVVCAVWPGRSYDSGMNRRNRARIQGEYRCMLAAGVALAGVSVAVERPLVVTLWLVPLVFAEPVHFLIELPEHVLCDRTSPDVFRNTRTIRGSRFSCWLTNGNNFHVEHHLRMAVPINKLGAVHGEVAGRLENYCVSYPRFYRTVLAHAWRTQWARRDGAPRAHP